MYARREQDFFWDGVDRGELLAQKCRACAELRHPPAPRCRHCGSGEWDAVPLSGRGHIHSWIVSRHPTQADIAPRTVVLVDLEEGVRIVSNLIDAGNVGNGAAVALEFGDVDGNRLPLFRTVPA